MRQHATVDIVPSEPSRVQVDGLLHDSRVAAVVIAHQQHRRREGPQLARRQVGVPRRAFPGREANAVDMIPARGRALRNKASLREAQRLPTRLADRGGAAIPACTGTKVERKRGNRPGIGSEHLQREVGKGR